MKEATIRIDSVVDLLRLLCVTVVELHHDRSVYHLVGIHFFFFVPSILTPMLRRTTWPAKRAPICISLQFWMWDRPKKCVLTGISLFFGGFCSRARSTKIIYTERYNYIMSSLSRGGGGEGGGGGGRTRLTVSSGSNTKVVESAGATEILTLELRPRRHVVWDDNVVDNEGMERKKSKRC